jgi:hypothetical protein
MTRTSCLSILASAALVAAFAAYGCGSNSVIPPDGGRSGVGGRTDSGAVIITGLGGQTGAGGRAGGDAGVNACTNNAPCTNGFTCEMPCNVGGVAGMRNCTCGGNNTLNCPGGNAGCIRPPVDAGFNMCMNNFPCTAGFTCEMACNVGGVAGMRACTCPANGGMLNCPAGNAACIRPDAGFNMCTNATPCTAGFTCEMQCAVNGVQGMRACTCAANGTLNCPAGNANCIRPTPDAGPDVGRPDVVVVPDAILDRPAPTDTGPG